MEDFMTLLKRGVIYDGCPIIAKGTIRVQNGELTIDTNHELMAVDGKNFAHLCDPNSEAEHFKQFQNESKVWESKIAEITSEKEQIMKGMKETVANLEEQLRQERELRTSVENNLAHQNTKKDSIEELKSKLDSVNRRLAEKDEKIKEMQNTTNEEILNLKGQISMLQDERAIDEKNANVLVDDFTQWKDTAQSKLHALQKELEKNRSTILSLRNEIEVAELEEAEQHETIISLQKENDKLRIELSGNIAAQESAAQPQKKPQLRTRESIRNILKNISAKPKDAAAKEKIAKEKESKARSASVAAPSDKRSSVAPQFDHRSSVAAQLDKRSSVASNPSM